VTIRQHDPTSLNKAATVIAALDSPLRLRILLKLHERSHVVHELVSHLGKSQPLISQHLRVLKRAGLVASLRSGREVSYRLVTSDAIDVIELAARLGEQVSQPQEPQDDLASRRESRRAQKTDVEEPATSVGKAAIVDPPTNVHEDMPGLVPATPEPPSPTSK
jgi:ArsR family transcriptional regulator, zinc-responsive transcriptional repressor